MTEFINSVATFNADPYCVEDEVMAQELFDETQGELEEITAPIQRTASCCASRTTNLSKHCAAHRSSQTDASRPQSSLQPQSESCLTGCEKNIRTRYPDTILCGRITRILYCLNKHEIPFVQRCAGGIFCAPKTTENMPNYAIA